MLLVCVSIGNCGVSGLGTLGVFCVESTLPLVAALLVLSGGNWSSPSVCVCSDGD